MSNLSKKGPNSTHFAPSPVFLMLNIGREHIHGPTWTSDNGTNDIKGPMSIIDDVKMSNLSEKGANSTHLCTVVSFRNFECWSHVQKRSNMDL